MLISPGCAPKLKSRYESQFLQLFDTLTIIVGYADSKDEFTEISQEIYDRLKEYHELYDIYNEYSGINNIKTINDNAGKAPVTVDRKIIDMLLFAIDAYNKTEGQCNVALGSVLSIWHDYREEGIEDPENAKVPPMEQLEEASKHTDINKLIIDKELSTVYLEDPLMKLDVGAVAKGYATEQVALALTAKAIDNILLSIGGNIRAIGGKPADSSGNVTPWTVGVKNPFSETSENLLNLSITRKSVVTSGNYERYYTVGDVNYHHIIDPKTLMPSNYFTAVTIVCSDSGMADALSTAVFNLPFEEGKALVDSLEDTGAMWLFEDQTTVFSSNFEALIKK